MHHSWPPCRCVSQSGCCIGWSILLGRTLHPVSPRTLNRIRSSFPCHVSLMKISKKIKNKRFTEEIFTFTFTFCLNIGEWAPTTHLLLKPDYFVSICITAPTLCSQIVMHQFNLCWRAHQRGQPGPGMQRMNESVVSQFSSLCLYFHKLLILLDLQRSSPPGFAENVFFRDREMCGRHVVSVSSCGSCLLI